MDTKPQAANPQQQSAEANPETQLLKDQITVNIFNRNAETNPSAYTDFLFDRLELGDIINRLNHAAGLTQLEERDSLVAQAYVIAGCGSSGGQLPAYCTNTSTCKCSGIGVYGCSTTDQTSTCKSKGCGCRKQ